MARKKKAVEEERRPHTIVAKFILLYGVEFQDERMRHALAFGKTPAEAAQNARNAIQNLLPDTRWEKSIEYVNPETFAKAGVSLDPDTN